MLGVCSVFSGYSRGILGVFSRYSQGMLGVCSGYARGMLGVRLGYARGRLGVHTFDLVIIQLQQHVLTLEKVHFVYGNKIFESKSRPAMDS